MSSIFSLSNPKKLVVYGMQLASYEPPSILPVPSQRGPLNLFVLRATPKDVDMNLVQCRFASRTLVARASAGVERLVTISSDSMVAKFNVTSTLGAHVPYRR